MLQDPGVATVQVPTVSEKDVAAQSSGLVPGNVATVEVPTVPDRDVPAASQSSGLVPGSLPTVQVPTVSEKDVASQSSGLCPGNGATVQASGSQTPCYGTSGKLSDEPSIMQMRQNLTGYQLWM